MMELVPIRVQGVPGTRASFTCSYKGHERLNIEFKLITLEEEPVGARVKREEEDPGYSWLATRQWTMEVGKKPGVVECSLVDGMGRRVGSLQALVTPGVGEE